MSFVSYFSDVYTLSGLAALLLTSVFTWVKGGPAERQGAALLIVNWFGTDVARAATGLAVPTSVMFLSDMMLSAGFLYISVRYSSLWLGLTMLLESATFSLHAVQLGDTDAPRWHGMIVYLLLNNVFNYLVVSSLAAGTLATMRKRAVDRKAQALSRAKAAERAARRFTIPPPQLANSL